MSGSNVIQCDQVCKSFPAVNGLGPWIRYRGRLPRRIALRGVSLAVAPQQLFGLLGPNGAGKTTMLKLLATLSLPDSGSIAVNGVDAAKNPDAVKRSIGLCTSEERSFYFRLTVLENLQFFGALAGLRGRVLRERIAYIIDLVDLQASLDNRFDTLSSGMRVRLALARSLLADPPILLLDEPTRGVDPVHADAIRTLLRDELVGRRKKTVVLTTNVLEEAWAVCDTVAILSGGELVASGAPAELNAQIGGRVRYTLTFEHVDAALVERLREVRGVVRVEQSNASRSTLTVEIIVGGRTLTDVLHEASSNGVAVLSVRPLDDGLLELFRIATKKGAP